MASLSDNFDRADGALGANWTVDAGAIAVASNKANDDSSGAAGRARYTGTALDSSNHTVSATVTINSTPNAAGVTARQASATQTYYDAIYAGQWRNPGWLLRKCVEGSFTTLDSESTAAWGNTRTITLEVDGSVQTATMDSGGGQLDGADSAITTGVYAGIDAGWQTNNEWDSWSAEDLASASAVPVFMYHYLNH